MNWKALVVMPFYEEMCNEFISAKQKPNKKITKSYEVINQVKNETQRMLIFGRKTIKSIRNS